MEIFPRLLRQYLAGAKFSIKSINFKRGLRLAYGSVLGNARRAKVKQLIQIRVAIICAAEKR